MYYWHWLTSSTVRQASDLCSQALKLVKAQRDLITDENALTVQKKVAELQQALNQGRPKAELETLMNALEHAASQNLKPYPDAAIRENIEMFLTTTSVILAVFTFFVQHFAIPTGSMQPTLFGITRQNHAGDPNFQIPSIGRRVYERLAKGVSYYHLTAPRDGALEAVEPPKTLIPFVRRQRIMIGGEWSTLWFVPTDLVDYAGLRPGQTYKQGDDVIKLKVTAGDHLFVDRLTYNFRPPTRGEIIIFASTGIPMLIQDTYYIKRLIGLEGEKVAVGDDRHVRINGNRLDASTPHFENVYSFKGAPLADHYSGHVNQKVANQNGGLNLAPLFFDGNQEQIVGPGRFLVMGDNTMNSFDSRGWGDFPKVKVIGKAFFVFWPFTERVGWGVR